MIFQEYQTIWLQPWCAKCETEAAKFASDGRQWCQDNVWDQCDECERRPVKYRLARQSEKSDDIIGDGQS
jgi:hypothetical protein